MKTTLLHFITVLFIFMPSLPLSADNTNSGNLLTFTDVWIAEAPPVSKVLAAYMTIQNPHSVAHKIVSTKSPCFRRVEIHRTIHENGMAKMHYLPELIVPAYGSVKLEPGGFHMMMVDPVQRLKAGDNCKITLMLANNKTLTTTAVVKKAHSSNQYKHH